MTVEISVAHQAAREAAGRNPSNQATLDLLASPDAGVSLSTLAVYATTRPATGGDPPGGDPLVTLPLTAAAGVLDEGLYQVVIDTPIQAQVTGAEVGGSIPLWGRLFDPAGAWVMDMDASVEGSAGEIQFSSTGQEGDPLSDVVRLYQGVFAQVTSFVLPG